MAVLSWASWAATSSAAAGVGSAGWAPRNGMCLIMIARNGSATANRIAQLKMLEMAAARDSRKAVRIGAGESRTVWTYSPW